MKHFSAELPVSPGLKRIIIKNCSKGQIRSSPPRVIRERWFRIWRGGGCSPTRGRGVQDHPFLRGGSVVQGSPGTKHFSFLALCAGKLGFIICRFPEHAILALFLKYLKTFFSGGRSGTIPNLPPFNTLTPPRPVQHDAGDDRKGHVAAGHSGVGGVGPGAPCGHPPC